MRERVEGALEKLRYRATPGDVAAAAGVKLVEADEALKALAYDALANLEVGWTIQSCDDMKLDSGMPQYGASAIQSSTCKCSWHTAALLTQHPLTSRSCQSCLLSPPCPLQVSKDGDVVYSFPPDFRSKLRNRSVLLRIKPALTKLQQVGSYLVRVAFGTTLMASIAIVWLAVAVLMSSRDNDRRDSGGSRSFGGGGGYYGTRLALDLTDLLYYWDPYYYHTQQVRQREGSVWQRGWVVLCMRAVGVVMAWEASRQEDDQADLPGCSDGSVIPLAMPLLMVASGCGMHSRGREGLLCGQLHFYSNATSILVTDGMNGTPAHAPSQLQI